MSERDELVTHLRRTPGWPRLGNAAADQIERDGREIERLTAENERLREALIDAEETLALVEEPPQPDRAIIPDVRALGAKVGYGNLMCTASALWAEQLESGGYSAGGAFVSGPCRGTVLRSLARARAALNGENDHE